MNCLHCGQLLTGKQRSFCSNSCNSKYHARHMSEASRQKRNAAFRRYYYRNHGEDEARRIAAKYYRGAHGKLYTVIRDDAYTGFPPGAVLCKAAFDELLGSGYLTPGMVVTDGDTTYQVIGDMYYPQEMIAR